MSDSRRRSPERSRRRTTREKRSSRDRFISDTDIPATTSNNNNTRTATTGPTRATTDMPSSSSYSRQPEPRAGPRYSYRPRAPSSSSSNSTSSSLLDISRRYPEKRRLGNAFTTFFTAPSERRVRRRRSGRKKQRRRVLYFGNSSSSSVNSDMAYGTGYIRRSSRDFGPRPSAPNTSTTTAAAAATAATAAAMATSPQGPATHYPPQQQPSEHGGQPRPNYQPAPPQHSNSYPGLGVAAGATAATALAAGAATGLAADYYRDDVQFPSKPPTPRRRKTDDEIMDIGRQLSDMAKMQNDGDLKRLGKTRPSGLVSAATQVDNYRRNSKYKNGGSRGLGMSKPFGGSSDDSDSEWESASDSDDYSDDSADSEMAYGTVVSQALKPGAAAAGAAGLAAGAHGFSSKKSSVVDPRLFGEVNSLRGVLNTPCGFGDDRDPRYAGLRRSATEPVGPARDAYLAASAPGPSHLGTSRQDLPRRSRPEPVPLQQPVPQKTVSPRLYDADKLEELSKQELRRSRDHSNDRGSGWVEAAAVGLGAAAVGTALAKDHKDRKTSTEYRDDEKEHRDKRSGRGDRREKEKEPRSKRDSYSSKYGADKNNDKGKDRQRTSRYEVDEPVDDPASSSRRSSRKYEARENSYQRADREDPGRRDDGEARPGAVDPFQYQVDTHEALPTPEPEPRRPLTPQVVTVEREPTFDDDDSDDSILEGRLSRRDSYDAGRVPTDQSREATSGRRHQDSRDSSVGKAAPIVAGSVGAAAIAGAVVANRSKSGRRDRESHADKDMRESTQPTSHSVQEEADRYYRESEAARKVAAEEIISRSRTPDRSVIDKWEKKDAPPVRIITPPDYHAHDAGRYDAPNADVRIDNKFTPREADKFLGLDAPAVYRSRDPDCDNDRPLLNLVYPTPSSSRQHTPLPDKQEREFRASDDGDGVRDEPVRDESSRSLVQTGKKSGSKTVGELRNNMPGKFEADDSGNGSDSASDKSRPRLSKSSQWGIIAAAVAGTSTEPANEPGAVTESPKEMEAGEFSRDLPTGAAGREQVYRVDDDAEAPPIPGPKPSSPRRQQMPGGFADDIEFAATLAAGLKDTGFDPNIVIDDPTYRRRESPPGSDELNGNGSHGKRVSETISDAAPRSRRGISGSESGFVIGEVDTPRDEPETAEPVDEWANVPVKLSKKEKKRLERQKKQEEAEAALSTSQAAPAEKIQEPPFEPPVKLSKKEQRKRDKAAARAQAFAPPDDEHMSAGAGTAEDADKLEGTEGSRDLATLETRKASATVDSAADLPPTDEVGADDGWDEPKKSKKKSKRKNGTTREVDDYDDAPLKRGTGPFDARDVSSVVSDSRFDERKRSSGRSYRYEDDDEAKSVASAPSNRQGRDSNRRSSGGLFSTIFGPGDGKKRDSFLDSAGTLGAGVGLAGAGALAASALSHPNATEEDRWEQEGSSRETGDWARGTGDLDPDVAPRAIKPAIDPQYGDLLPLPPSEPASPVGAMDELPSLPDSRPDTPPEEQSIRREFLSHSRRRSTHETPTKSPSNTAIPIQLRLGQRSGPSSPAVFKSSPPASSPVIGGPESPARRQSRPTSWDTSREIKPLYLIEHARHSSMDHSAEQTELPALPPSEASSRGSPGPGSEAWESADEYSHGDLDKATRPLLSLDTDMPVDAPKYDQEGSQETTPKAETRPRLPDISSSSAEPPQAPLPEDASREQDPDPVDPMSKDRSSYLLRSALSSTRSVRTIGNENDEQGIDLDATPSKKPSTKKDWIGTGGGMASADEPPSGVVDGSGTDSSAVRDAPASATEEAFTPSGYAPDALTEEAPAAEFTMLTGKAKKKAKKAAKKRQVLGLDDAPPAPETVASQSAQDQPAEVSSASQAEPHGDMEVPKRDKKGKNKKQILPWDEEMGEAPAPSQGAADGTTIEPPKTTEPAFKDDESREVETDISAQGMQREKPSGEATGPDEPGMGLDPVEQVQAAESRGDLTDPTVPNTTERIPAEEDVQTGPTTNPYDSWETPGKKGKKKKKTSKSTLPWDEEPVKTDTAPADLEVSPMEVSAEPVNRTAGEDGATAPELPAAGEGEVVSAEQTSAQEPPDDPNPDNEWPSPFLSKKEKKKQKKDKRKSLGLETVGGHFDANDAEERATGAKAEDISHSEPFGTSEKPLAMPSSADAASAAHATAWDTTLESTGQPDGRNEDTLDEQKMGLRDTNATQATLQEQISEPLFSQGEPPLDTTQDPTTSAEPSQAPYEEMAKGDVGGIQYDSTETVWEGTQVSKKKSKKDKKKQGASWDALDWSVPGDVAAHTASTTHTTEPLLESSVGGDSKQTEDVPLPALSGKSETVAVEPPEALPEDEWDRPMTKKEKKKKAKQQQKKDGETQQELENSAGWDLPDDFFSKPPPTEEATEDLGWDQPARAASEPENIAESTNPGADDTTAASYNDAQAEDEWSIPTSSKKAKKAKKRQARLSMEKALELVQEPESEVPQEAGPRPESNAQDKSRGDSAAEPSTQATSEDAETLLRASQPSEQTNPAADDSDFFPAKLSKKEKKKLQKKKAAQGALGDTVDTAVEEPFQEETPQAQELEPMETASERGFGDESGDPSPDNTSGFVTPAESVSGQHPGVNPEDEWGGFSLKKSKKDKRKKKAKDTESEQEQEPEMTPQPEPESDTRDTDDIGQPSRTAKDLSDAHGTGHDAITAGSTPIQQSTEQHAEKPAEDWSFGLSKKERKKKKNKSVTFDLGNSGFPDYDNGDNGKHSGIEGITEADIPSDTQPGPTEVDRSDATSSEFPQRSLATEGEGRSEQSTGQHDSSTPMLTDTPTAEEPLSSAEIDSDHLWSMPMSKKEKKKKKAKAQADTLSAESTKELSEEVEPISRPTVTDTVLEDHATPFIPDVAAERGGPQAELRSETVASTEAPDGSREEPTADDDSWSLGLSKKEKKKKKSKNTDTGRESLEATRATGESEAASTDEAPTSIQEPEPALEAFGAEQPEVNDKIERDDDWTAGLSKKEKKKMKKKQKSIPLDWDSAAGSASELNRSGESQEPDIYPSPAAPEELDQPQDLESEGFSLAGLSKKEKKKMQKRALSSGLSDPTEQTEVSAAPASTENNRNAEESQRSEVSWGEAGVSSATSAPNPAPNPAADSTPHDAVSTTSYDVSRDPVQQEPWSEQVMEGTPSQELGQKPRDPHVAEPTEDPTEIVEKGRPQQKEPIDTESKQRETGVNATDTAIAAGAAVAGATATASLAKSVGGKKGKKGKKKKIVDKRQPAEGDFFDDPSLWESADKKNLEDKADDGAGNSFWDGDVTKAQLAERDNDNFWGADDVDEDARDKEETSRGGESASRGLGGDDGPTTEDDTSPGTIPETVRAENYRQMSDEGETIGHKSEHKEEGTRADKRGGPWTGAKSESFSESDSGWKETSRQGAPLGDESEETPTSEPVGLLRRGTDVEEPVGGLLREDSQASALSGGFGSDFGGTRLSPTRPLPAVPEIPETETETRDLGTAREVNRDSGFAGDSPNPRRRSHRLADDYHEQRDSGVHTDDWDQPPPARGSETRGMDRSPHTRAMTPVLREPDAPNLTPEPEKKWGRTPRATEEETREPSSLKPKKSRDYGSLGLGSDGAAAALGAAGSGVGAATIASAGRRSVSDTSHARSAQGGGGGGDGQRQSSSPGDQPPAQPLADPWLRRSVSNTSLSRKRTPEPLRFRPDSPGIKRPGSQAEGLRSTPTPPLRRVDKRVSGDLRALRQENNTTPVANEGRVRSKDMADVYDGFGEGRIGSPRSPTRPHSMRRRQSMQVLELESRVDQLMAENRLLSEARTHAEQSLNQRSVSDVAERDAEIDSLKRSLQHLQSEVARLTEVNAGLTSANAELADAHSGRYGDLEARHGVVASRGIDGPGGVSNNTLEQTLQDKDAEIADLRAQLEDAKEQVRDMQRQILASKAGDADFLNMQDEDYFDSRCQQLCSHVQQWVLRFSKFSDMRACRLTSEINDEKIIDRLDNAVLDGTDVDRYLNDRVRRRDVFMSMTMNMIWEFIFTRYLFGMDREQRQKLKSLEKMLTEVGPPQAVRLWRAVTLTLLSRRDGFKSQKEQDTEAVVQAIFQTLCKILPPPGNREAQIESQLRRVLQEAVELSIEMRTQKAEYMMLPPLQPEYDSEGEPASTFQFNASMMNERSGKTTATNEELEEEGAIVRLVLFPLVVKKGDDNGVGEEEVVLCPAQVIVAGDRDRRSIGPSSDAGGASLGGPSHLSVVTEHMGV